MNQKEINRFNTLYQRHQKNLALQGNRGQVFRVSGDISPISIPFQ